MSKTPQKDFREQLVKFHEMLDAGERDPDKLTKEIATAKELSKKLPMFYGDDISVNIGAALRNSAKEYGVIIEKKGLFGRKASDSVSPLFKDAMNYALYGHDTENDHKAEELPHDFSNALYVAEKMSLPVKTTSLDKFKIERIEEAAAKAFRPIAGSDASSISADGSQSPTSEADRLLALLARHERGSAAGDAPAVRAALGHTGASADIPRHVEALAGMGRNPLASGKGAVKKGVGGRDK